MTAAKSISIMTGADARETVCRSLAHSMRAIGSSLGPAGLGLMYDGGSGGPRHASGGLAIARQITPERGPWSVAPKMLTDTLWDVQRDLGDGTARVACIAAAVHATAAVRVNQGIAPNQLIGAIRQISDKLPDLLSAQRCVAPDALAIARAACDDGEVAKAVANMFASFPEEGAIDVREGWQPGVHIEQAAGYCIDVKPDIVGASPEEQGLRFEMDAVHVLVVNEILDEFGALARILEQFVSRAKSLLIVARGIEGAARATLVSNRAGLRMHVLGLVPADVGLDAMRVMEDLCAVAGATLVSQETGTSMSGVRPAMLGRTGRLIIDRSRAVFIEPAGSAEDVACRKKMLLAQAEAQRHLSLDRERALRRAARLGGGWAEVRVGGRTAWETERRIDDARAALAALRAANRQGVVAGGGQALGAVADALPDVIHREFADMRPDVRAAALDCVVSGCRAVAKQIARNGGVDAAALRVPFDVVDPLSTTLELLRRALSLASAMLTIEVLIW
jgi:chaperonin GroEL (HSP60 family)